MTSHVNPMVLKRALLRLTLLRFFNGNLESLKALSEILLERCQTDEQVSRVTERILAENDDWLGPRSFRAEVSRIWRELYGPKTQTDGVDCSLEWRAPWKDAA